MLLDMFHRHLVSLFLILLFSIRLWTRKSFRNAEARYFWVTVVSCLMLALEDTLETMASLEPSLRFWRTLLSVLGYTFRSTAALGLLLVIVPREQRRFRLWIPSLITLLVCGTAFFTDIAFGFDADYAFYRGPLGYVAFIVPTFYLLLILWITFRRLTEKNSVEKYLVPVCAVFCLSAAIVDVTGGGVRLNEAIMICSIFFYIFLYSHDNRRDPLTGLLNRQAFYDDCAQFEKSIGAVASLDMNGLKERNDTLGHQAGDDALQGIGKCIAAQTDRSTLAYRIGGDEFAILFLHEDEGKAARVTEEIKASVERCGYSVSVGCALCDRSGSLEEAIRESDRRMYEDKERYYQTHPRDRRSGPGTESASH